ncbi:amidohydrolase [Catellatospora sp. KI3]|uniref:amidohydrolase n=1 Tax=Catellatospora sp. KI3 TaxID=3041620 RepID=UPI002482F522|nr:amidohydrolase [Catellatospora sp. KI3]MDI1460299.1 amidohydrolase [Catellatospora sp. KI3]
MDLVLRGGIVYGGSGATAVAVSGGRIAAIGSDEQVSALAGRGTEVVDLGGGLLLPGLQDAHAHPVFAGLNLLRCELTELQDRAGYLAAVAAYAARTDGTWIMGAGWSYDAFGGAQPCRQDLDGVVADRPVYLAVRDAHSAWCNSRALALAGIDRHTPDPEGGRIERDPDGEPTGVLHESAMELVSSVAPRPDAAEIRRALLLAQSRLHSLGVTAWQDAIVGDYGGWPDCFEAYLAADREGLLTARVRGALWWEPSRGLEQLDDLRQRRELARGGGARFRTETVKIMQDGVAENFTAAMLDPYLDGCGCATDRRGISRVEPEHLREIVGRLDRDGFQVHFHAIGDRAAREILDAVEPVAGSRLRHHVAHVQVVHPDDVPRFGRLGVTVTMQALWATHEPAMDELTIPFLGQPRASWQYPFGGVWRSGGRLAAGSDWPVSDPDPFKAIHVAVNRVPHGVDGPPLGPEQGIELETAVRAYTEGSAYVNHLDETGVIAVGRLADLALLDRDPFAGPVTEIGATRAVRTWVEGRPVHGA